MTEIYVTVNDYGEVYTSSNVLGIMGEHNARTLVFNAPVYEGSTYEVWFDVGEASPYSASVKDGKCVVPASVLIKETVSLQWVAVKGTEIMAKSQVFDMVVLESLDEDVLPAPTYEQAQTLLQQITSIIPEGGERNDILVKGNGADNTSTWKSLSDLSKAEAFAQTFVVEWYNEPTDEQIAANISTVKSYSSAQFPKSLILRIPQDSSKKYLSLSGITIKGTVFDFMFSGALPAQGATVNARRITVDIATDEYSQYSFSWHYFQDTDKLKLIDIEENAQVNTIEEITVNGTQLIPYNKSVEITVPQKISVLNNDTHFTTKGEVQNMIDSAFSAITDGDGVAY